MRRDEGDRPRKMTRMGKAASLAAAITAMAALAAPARAQDAPARALRQGVVAIVNDNIISSYDLHQRVRLLIATSGVQPTAQNTPQIEQEAVNELIDERLEMQEVRRAEKDQKFKIVADDDDVEPSASTRSRSNLPHERRAAPGRLRQRRHRPDTFRDQLRAEISWQRWIARPLRRLAAEDQPGADQRGHRRDARPRPPSRNICSARFSSTPITAGGMPQARGRRRPAGHPAAAGRAVHARSRGSSPPPRRRPPAATPAG